MSIKYHISNIAEKFIESVEKNIIYSSINNCFDICIKQLNHNILYNNQHKLEIQHNLILINSIMHLATNPLSESGGCFIHNSRPINLKKEDLYLMKQRTKNTHKILFDSYLEKSWGGFEKSHTINYGIPKNFNNFNTEKRPNIGVFNLQKNVELSNVIIPMLKNQKNSVLEITATQDLEKILNTCSHVIEMYEHNVINSLFGIACGCVALMPKTDYLDSTYPEITTFENINNMLYIIQNGGTVSQLDDRYNFDRFKVEMDKIINIINDEVHVL